MLLFRLFERLLEPTAPPEDTAPPSGLAAFYWHYARQARWLVVALFVAASSWRCSIRPSRSSSAASSP